MERISDRIKALAASQTLAMSQKSNELKAQGVDVINLSVGEPDFTTPEHIKEAAKRAIDDNFSFYSPVPGYMSLRKAIADKLSNENGLSFAPEQIVVGNGAKQALCNVILATVNPGDEVVIPTPAWVSYVEMVKLAEGHTVEVPATIEQDFKITPHQLEEAITERTKVVMFCSPSNPTGSVYTRKELQALVDVIARHENILVLSDEIYEHINFTGEFTKASRRRPLMADALSIRPSPMDTSAVSQRNTVPPVFCSRSAVSSAVSARLRATSGTGPVTVTA